MFDNPLMLAGLGGVALPLVIHLLARARYRTVDWGAMMFIGAPPVKLTEGVRLREITLLLVRMVAIGLLAVALARPIARSAATSPVAASRVAAAIVVDCSGSMAYEDFGGTRMDRARDAVLQILSTFRRGDRVALIPADARQSAPPQLTGDLQSLTARVTELKPTAGAADLLGAIDIAVAMLDRQDHAEKKLFVVCDKQRANWRDPAGAQKRGQTRLLQKRGLSPLLVTVGGDEADNVAVEGIELINPPIVVGCPSDVVVSVKNHGTGSATGLPLTLRVGPKDVQTTTINIPAGGRGALSATVNFPTTGPVVLSVDVKSSGATLDDHRDTVVDVSSPVRVLVVRGNATSSDATALRAALAPFGALGQAGADVASVSVVSAGEWDATDLSNYQVIVLDDVPAPTAAQADAIGQFVYTGGGLLLAPGPSSQTNVYNQLFYREDVGLLPALLQPAVTPPTPVAIEPSTVDVSHPMLRFLTGRVGSIAAQFERFIATTGRTPAAHALASFTSGDAFLLESSYGRGRVLLMTSSLGSAWSTMPMTNLFLPLMQSAARYLAGSGVVDRNIVAGQELTAFFDPPVTGSRGAVIRPDGTRDTCDVATIDQRSEARYGRTDLPGLYTIRVGPRGQERSVVFSVAAPASESDLTPLGEVEWRQLEKEYGFTRVEAGDRALVAQLTEKRVGPGEYWLWGLVGVIALLVIELGLARRWGAQVR